MGNSLKDRVLEATEIVDLVGERVALTRKGKDFLGLCPFHNDHHASLSVSPSKQIFKCWSCGVGGDAIKFVMLSQRVEFREALRILAERAGIDLSPTAKAPQAADDRGELRRVLDWARTHFQRNLAAAMGQAARDYAIRRGLSPETVERLRLGLAPDSWNDLRTAGARAGIDEGLLRAAGLLTSNESGQVYDRFRNRLIFPIQDAMGRCVAFGGRALGDDPAKYLNSPENALFSKSRILYGLDAARQSIPQAGSVVVVEGYMDAVLLQQFGVTNVVATLGTALTDSHVKLLRPLTNTVYLCFDGDEAGMKAADRAVETAWRHKLSVRIVTLPDEMDPADCVLASGSNGFTSHLHSAVDALEFKWQGMQRAFDGAGEFARDAAVGEFIAFVARTGSAGGLDAVAEGVLVSRLSDMLNLPARAIYERLAGGRAVSRGAPAVVDTPGSSSAYDESLRGLPRGLVAGVEELFGLGVWVPGAFERVRGALERTSGYCSLWRRMFESIVDVYENHGGVSSAEVVDAIDEASLFDLLERCRHAVIGADASNGSTCEGALARVEGELQLLRMKKLRENLRDPAGSSAQRDAALRELAALGRSQGGCLALERRGATIGPRG